MRPRSCGQRSMLSEISAYIVVAVVLAVGNAASAQENASPATSWTLTSTPVLNAGIAIPGGVVGNLPPPALTSDSESSEATLAELAGRVGLERFTRNNLNAPLRIQIDDLTLDDGQRCGYAVHSAYVLYADVEKLKDRDFMESVFGARQEKQADDADGAGMQELTHAELQSMGIENAGDLKLVRIELPLLRKVVIRGLIEVERVEADNAFLLAWRLVSPERLQELGGELDSSEAGGTWAALGTNDLGERTEGESHPYYGLGGYVSMMATGLEENQLLVESRMILHEHEDWFSGSRYLRSKLPLSLQSSAKDLRRKLRSSRSDD